MKEINVTLKEKVDFSKAKIGDDVFCVSNGIGKIVDICKVHDYPIEIVFGRQRFTAAIDGKWHISHKYASIYFFNPDTQEVLYERPETEIDWNAYKWKLIEVRDENEDGWCRRKLLLYMPEFPKKFLCCLGDDIEYVHLWKQARLIKENS
mgnify:CR=1 FL=1